jgi:hypothetical protein
MLTTQEKETILAEFPKNIKLSYENIVHKKVSNYDFVSAIPQGKKAFAWFQFTHATEKPVCYVLEVQGKQKQISEIRIANTCFDSSLSYGTIFYGTLFYHQKQAFYTIEDLFYYQGNKVMHEPWNQKLSYLKKIMEKQIQQVSYNPNFLIFGLPFMHTDYDLLMKKIDELPYRVYAIHFRKDRFLSSLSTFSTFEKSGAKPPEPNTNPNTKPNYKINFNTNTNLNTNPNYKINSKPNTKLNTNPNYKINSKPNTKPNYNQRTTRDFRVRPDLQNDIYYLYCCNEKGEEVYHDLACIPDYKTSLLMNRLFRKIKENDNLDALEESDDEEEFQNEKEDRFVFLDREYTMSCSYHYKFKKWVPLQISPSGSKLILSKDLPFLEKNKH